MGCRMRKHGCFQIAAPEQPAMDQASQYFQADSAGNQGSRGVHSLGVGQFEDGVAS